MDEVVVPRGGPGNREPGDRHCLVRVRVPVRQARSRIVGVEGQALSGYQTAQHRRAGQRHVRRPVIGAGDGGYTSDIKVLRIHLPGQGGLGQGVVADVRTGQAEAGVHHRLGVADIGVRVGGGQRPQLHIFRTQHPNQGSPAHRRITGAVIETVRHRRPRDRQSLGGDRARHPRRLNELIIASQGGAVQENVTGGGHGFPRAHILVGIAGRRAGYIQERRGVGQNSHQRRRGRQRGPRGSVIFPSRHRHTGDGHGPNGNIRRQGRHRPGQDVVRRLGARQA